MRRAFIDFETKAQSDKAQASLHDGQIDGQLVRINVAIPPPRTNSRPRCTFVFLACRIRCILNRSTLHRLSTTFPNTTTILQASLKLT